MGERLIDQIAQWLTDGFSRRAAVKAGAVAFGLSAAGGLGRSRTILAQPSQAVCHCHYLCDGVSTENCVIGSNSNDCRPKPGCVTDGAVCLTSSMKQCQEELRLSRT